MVDVVAAETPERLGSRLLRKDVFSGVSVMIIVVWR